MENTSIRKKLSNFSREKENLINEVSNEREMKERLEAYCREIQKQNKQINEEYQQMMTDEQSKKEHINEKLEKSLGELKQKCEESEKEKEEQSKINEK